MKIRLYFIFFLGILFITGCKKDSSNPVEPVPPSASTTVNISGSIKLPTNATINPQSLSILSSVTNATIGSDSKFNVEVERDMYAYVYILDSQGNTVGASYSNPQNGLQIDEVSTSIALVNMFPVDWGSYGISIDQLQAEIQQNNNFPVLKDYVNNIMINDPSNLINYELHPSILNTASDIAINIVRNHGGVLKKENQFENLENNLEVQDIPNSSKVKIINPKATPYGICAFNTSGDPHQLSSYTSSQWPWFVYGKTLSWFVIPKDATANYDLGNDGNYILMLSRMDPDFTFAIPPAGSIKYLFDYYWGVSNGDYYKALQSNTKLKGMMGGLIYITARTLGILSAIDPSKTTSLFQIIIEDPKTYEALLKLSIDNGSVVEPGVKGAIKVLGKMLSKPENAKIFADLFKNFGVKLSADYIKKVAAQFTAVLSVLSAAGDVVLLCAFIYDMIASESTIVYSINKNNGNANISVSLPPTIPSLYAPSSGLEGTSYDITLTSTDPENDNIKYIIYYGDGQTDESGFIPSGQSYMFSHQFSSGKYKLYAIAVDDKGSMSSQSDYYNISIVPAGGFVENFETYPIGSFHSNSFWNVGYELPSEVRISSVGYHSNQSVKFIDYDPSIGNDSSNYAHILGYVVSNPSTVEFAIRVDNISDAFGVRVWQNSEDWNTMGYYVLINNGYFEWVKNASDINNSNDFIPIKAIISERWYDIKLEINWATNSYDIYIDGILVKSGATFVGYNRTFNIINSASIFQAVAFTNAQCRAGYLDEISMKGATLGKLEKLANNKFDAKHLSQISENR